MYVQSKTKFILPDDTEGLDGTIKALAPTPKGQVRQSQMETTKGFFIQPLKMRPTPL